MNEDRSRRVRHAIAKVLRAIWYAALLLYALHLLVKDPVSTLTVFGGFCLLLLLANAVAYLMEWLES